MIIRAIKSLCSVRRMNLDVINYVRINFTGDAGVYKTVINVN